MSSQGAPPPPHRTPAPTPESAVLIAKLAGLADSRRDEDHEELTQLLLDTRTLDLLDEPDARDKSRPGDLHIAEIVKHLVANPSAPATRSLDALTRNETFNTSWQRQELLIHALAVQRPLSPESLAFLDAQGKADSVNLHIAIDALCNNSSEPALALLGHKLIDPALDSLYKIAWMRGPILLHRRDPEMLRAAEKWLTKGKLDRELREALAEALFDYRPDEWYAGGEGFPRPAPEPAAKSETAVLVRRIGQTIIESDFPEKIKASVRSTLKLLAP